MKRKFVAWFVFIVCVFGFIQSVFCAVDTDYSRDEIMIPYEWKYYLGDAPGAEKPDFFDADWPTWLAPWKFIHKETPSVPPGYNGVIWYRMDFLIPEKALGTGLICELGQVRGATKLYVNGHKLVLKRKRGAIFADIPLNILYRDNRNVLALRIAGHGRDSGRVKGPLHLTWQNLARRLKGRMLVTSFPTDPETGKARIRVEFRHAEGSDEEWKFRIEVIDYFGRSVLTDSTSRPSGKKSWHHDLSFKVNSTKPYRVQLIDEKTGEIATRYASCDKLIGDRQRLLLSGSQWKMLAVKEDKFGAFPTKNAAWESWTIPPKTHTSLGDQFSKWHYQFTESGDLKEGPTWSSPMKNACEPFMKHNCHRAWFMRDFIIPTSMTGKRISLEIGASWGTTLVYVNGKFIKKSIDSFNPIICDITKIARIGGKNTVLLAVADLTSLLNPEKLSSILSPGGIYKRGPLNALLGVVGVWGRGIKVFRPGYKYGGPWQDVNLYARPRVSVDDTFVIPKFKEKRLQAEITVSNHSPNSASITIEGAIWKEGKEIAQLGKRKLILDGGKTEKIKLEGAVKLSPWFPHSPVLYRFQSRIIDNQKRLLDTHDMRFGYRKIQTDGIRFRLNEEIYNIRRFSGSMQKICDTPHGLSHYMRYMKNSGRNLWRVPHDIFGGDFLSPFWLDVADEIGLPLQVEVAWHAKYQDIHSSVFWENMRAHVRATALLHRNRPSVFFYSLGNEVVEHSPDRTPDLPFSVRDAIKTVDPTRPLSFDDDDDYLRDGMDFITIHYPYPLGKHFLWPDSAFWYQTPMPVVFNRAPGVFNWKRDRPIIVGEMADHSYAEAPNGVSTILGDKTYFRQHTWIQAWLKGSRMIHDGARLSGVAGTNMWMSGFRDAFVYKSLEPSICAILREYDHTFYSGEKIKRTFSLLNDSLKTEGLELRWRLRAASGVLGSGKVSKKLSPGGREDIILTLHLPKVKERSTMALEWEVFDGREVHDFSSRTYKVLPLLEVSKNIHVPIYDPSGLTKKALNRLGVMTKQIDNLTSGSMKGLDSLWIGENALSGNSGYNPKILQDFVSRGGRLVILRQEAPFVAPTPMKMEPDIRHESNQAWIRFPDHPVLAGLEEEDFTYWRARAQNYPPHTSGGARKKAEPTWSLNHRVCKQAYAKPSRGNFRILLDSGGPDGLRWTPLVEIPFGKGSVLLCQLMLTDVLCHEPVADRLVTNMHSWTNESEIVPEKRLRLLAKASPEIAEALEEAGVQYTEINYPLSVSELPLQGVLLIGPRENISSDESEMLSHWMKRGGTVWLHNLQSTEKTKAAKIPSEKLVAWWKMDESAWKGKTGEVKDASGRGNNLTAEVWEDFPKTAPGVFNRAVEFDGKRQYLYAVPDREDLRMGEKDFTLMAWVKSNDLTLRCGILGMAVGDYAATNYGFYQRMKDDKKSPQFYFIVNGDPATEKPFFNFIAAPAQSGWHHLCGVRKWNEKLCLYVDGKLVAEGGRGAINPDKKGEYFLIGSAFHWKNGPSGFFNGLIDDVRLYKGIAFTKEQIRTIYIESQYDSLSNFRELLPEGFSLASKIPPAVELVTNRGLGSGLSNYELWWRRGRYQWGDRTESITDIAKEVLVKGKNLDAQVFTNPPVLVQWKIGKGSLVVDQLRWEALRSQPQAMRVVNTLATNLGCISISKEDKAIDLEYFPLNLQAYCNRALSLRDVMPDRPPLIDEGDNDLRELPKGIHEFKGVKFLIHEATVLKSKRLPFLPTKSGLIQIGRKALKVYFLHTAVGSGKGKIGSYIIHYASGLKTELSIVNGYNVKDWWDVGKDLEGAKLAWSGKNPVRDPVCVYLMEWVNTHPDREISSIQMCSEQGPVTPILLGVSTASLKHGRVSEEPCQRFIPLDFHMIANRSITTGGPYGWPDVPENDLREFETGNVLLNGIPAQVASDPKSCLILEVPQITKLRKGGVAKGEFPKEATISVEKKADAVFFLQTSMYGAGSIVYAIEYSDGKYEEISIVGGKNLWDWWKNVDFLPRRMRLAWKGYNYYAQRPVYVYWYEWENPRSDKVIKNIHVRQMKGSTKGIPILLGITMGYKK